MARPFVLPLRCLTIDTGGLCVCVCMRQRARAAVVVGIMTTMMIMMIIMMMMITIMMTVGLHEQNVLIHTERSESTVHHTQLMMLDMMYEGMRVYGYSLFRIKRRKNTDGRMNEAVREKKREGYRIWAISNQSSGHRVDTVADIDSCTERAIDRQRKREKERERRHRRRVGPG